MSAFAIVLVLSAAVIHATWNYLAKRTYGGIPLVWLYGTIATIAYSPFILILFLTTSVPLGAPQLLSMAVSSILQLAYFLLLTRGYQVGDLSLVYPLARGTGPMISTLLAVLLFGERPSVLAVFGALLIAGGIFVLTGDPRKLRQAGAGQGILFALMTGVMIASYTLWDKAAVSVYLVPPLLLNWFSSIMHSLVLLPFARQRWGAVLREWHDHRWQVLGIAVLSPLAYLLVLTALTFSRVSYVAPMRESSVLLGTLLGVRLLAEGDTRRRVLGASIIVVGVVAIGLG
ncbi:MAG: DMT family transporter [Chloroflexota bacterium]